MTFEVGQQATIRKVITARDIELFGEVSTDLNPLHFDDSYAATTRFGERIAHGMISAGLISAVIGNHLPGAGAVYLGQTLRFQAPVKINDEITVTATITAIREDKPIFTIETICTNQAGTVVTSGEAKVLYDPPEA